MREDSVRLDRANGVTRVVLDRPPLNVLDVEALQELEGSFATLAGDPDVGVVVLTGAGTAFCAGVDVEDHLPQWVKGTLEHFHAALRRIWELEAPVVAALNGAALGGGCEIALACDVVLAREDAVLGQPEVQLGVFPPAAAALLPRLVGRQRALDLILTGRRLDAEEAKGIGLVQRVVPAGAFEEEVSAYAERLAGLSQPVLRLAKRAVMEGIDRPFPEALDRAERIYLDELVPLADSMEGLVAFLEKRGPVWRDA